MSDVYIGTITYFAGNFAPRGYAFCNGQSLPINQNQALFAILGTTYGGNGTTTFNLPDLRGRVPVHAGQSTTGTSYSLGQTGGTESATLTQNQLPAHTHGFVPGAGTLTASTAKGTTGTPADSLVLSRGVDGDDDPNAVPFIYGPAQGSGNVALGGVNVAGTISPTGGNQPVPVVQPFTVLNALIAIQGLFPPRN